MLKPVLLCLVMFLLPALSVCAASQDGDNADVIGLIPSQQLLSSHPAFAEQYATYETTADDLASMQQLSGSTIVVLFGSWCHDSVREVPRLLKLLDQSGVTLASLQLHAVDRNKQHPGNLHSQYDLRYTPTIIVLRDGKELGRVIEKPQQSLAADLAAIAAQ